MTNNPVELQDAIERVALLPCPFCGQSGPTKLGYLPDFSGLNHGVRCVCGAVMRYGDKESTIKAWNTRAALSVSGDMREALERVRNGLKAYEPNSGVMSPVPLSRLIEIIDAALSPQQKDRDGE